ncbi:RiPP maturation radical SAM C-methyltransferase [uncultured Roseobacter sp.]|uniref:RiPP maturation radical SAM C-methyltransferase n=1 Tax=uncultured Roseobacter sp. TaxID=114847 RepID=UPI0026343F42|nr:RiPP maturation radical SAM C-methyltransferase [uncultured Roseobacter sp.]
MRNRSDPARVHLVSLPFTSLQYPNLGASLLGTALKERGVDCTIDYFAFDFAEAIGIDAYLFLSHEKFYQAFLGEWVFSPLVFERPESLDMEYLTDVLPDFADPLEALLLTNSALAARKAVRGFIENCADQIAENAPEIVGVTTSFQQNMASIAFAKALKQRAPDTTIVFGGANCEAELGRHLLDRFDFIDAVCNGDGDVSFPTFVERFSLEKPLPEVPGITTRNGSSSRQQGGLVQALDDLPTPDFSEFYARFDKTPGLDELLQPAPTIETSRGCWWGAKHHCTFCGLNGNSMAYRSKSPDRAFAEFQTQAEKYGPNFVVVDNILDYAYFDSLLPMLRDAPTPFLMHYEVKSNLFPKHIKAMAEAGVRKIQPGIETLDSQILRLMKKGVTAQQNVQTLKLCAQAGIFVDWGFIFGFPGEDPKSYEQMAEFIPYLHHLQPPTAFGPVRADRFSPYFTRPSDHGIQLAPAKPYKYIYAGVGDELSKFSYHHQMFGGDIDDAAEYTEPAKEAVKKWMSCHSDARFYIDDDNATQMTLVDSRIGKEEKRWRLSVLETEIVRLSACIIARDRVADKLAQRFSASQVEATIGKLLEDGVLLKERNSILALPLQPGLYRQAPTWPQIRAEVFQADLEGVQ